MRDFGSLLRKAAWAPIAVLIFHQWLLRSPWHLELDWFMHDIGGVAAAYFIYHAISGLSGLFGALTRLAHVSMVFGLTCAVAMVWEIAEFAGGIDDSAAEVIADLTFGMSGAVVLLVGSLARGYVARR